MRAACRKLAGKVSVLVLILSMLLSIVKLPLVYAYFTTAPRQSEGFTFLLIEEIGHANLGAGLGLSRPFLFAEEEQEVRQLSASNPLNLMSSSLFEEGSSGERRMQFHKRNEYKIPYPGETVEAVISLQEQHYYASEIFLPSVKLHYEGQFSFALGGEVADGALVATFDLFELWRWFEEAAAVPEVVALAVSGEGYREDGAVFFFRGETVVPLKGKYDIREIHILGPDVLCIPPQESVSAAFILIDQDGDAVDGAHWRLAEEIEGVSLDEKTGELSAAPQAAGRTVVLEAVLESQGRLHFAWAELALYPCPLALAQVEGPDGAEGKGDGDDEGREGAAEDSAAPLEGEGANDGETNEAPGGAAGSGGDLLPDPAGNESEKDQDPHNKEAPAASEINAVIPKEEEETEEGGGPAGESSSSGSGDSREDYNGDYE